MRTSINIDDKLLEEAQKVTAIKTKRALVDLSLKELVRRKRLEHLIGLYGTDPIDLTLQEVEESRKDEI
jgi:Arc/MetJ family transcription regulator